MFDISKLLQNIVRRVSDGTTVPVRKEYLEYVVEELTKHQIEHTVFEEDTVDGSTVFVRRIKNS